MKWEKIREQYPKMWLLVEAIVAHTDGDRRIIEEMSVIDTYDHSREAMHDYKKMQIEDPNREILVVHTDRQKLDIKIKRWVGLRGIRTKGMV